MTPERYELINALADAALELAPGERSVYLDKSCAGDQQLRAEVEELLAAQASGSGFLETPLLHALAKDLADPRARDLSGQQVHRYTIISLLGRGGIGEVWLARDARLDRQVALKLLAPRFATDPDQVLRFQQEARAASALNHPNIVTIYEIAEADGVDIIAEEFVTGETLRQRLAGGALPLLSLLEIGAQVAAALAAAQQAGVVHRDIKPENIMVRPDGLVKVLDFGLARFLEGRQAAAAANLSVSRPGLVLGTARYMSPEQARSLPAGPASDVFSLGVVLYEMATGTPPFTGATASDIMAEILTKQAPPLLPYRPEIPAELERIIARCLEKEASARYASAGELQRDLNRVRWRIQAPGEPTPASDELAPAVSRRASRSRWKLPAVAALLLLAGVAGLPWLRQRTPVLSLGSMRMSRLMTRGKIGDAALSADAKFVAYTLEEERGQSLRVVQLASGSEIQALAPEPGGLSELSFSPDANYIYYRRNSPGGVPEVYRVASLGGEPVHMVSDAGAVTVSPSGRQIAFFRPHPASRETSLVMANADGTDERTIVTRRLPRYFSQFGLAWSPDERRIACFGGDSTTFTRDAFRLMEITVATGVERTISRRAWRWAESIVWPAAGEPIFFDVSDDMDDRYQIWTASAKTGEVSRLTHDLNQYAHLAMSADAKTALAVQSQVAADLWIVPGYDSSRAVQITSGDLQNLNMISWTPDGRIVYSAQGGDYHNIWVMDADGRNVRQLTRGPGSKTEVAVTRDGKYILYQMEGKIWRMDQDGANPVQLTHGALDVHPAPSADSRFVIYASFPGWSPGLNGKPNLWKVSIDGGPPVQLTTVASSIPKVSPDGRSIGFLYFPERYPQLLQRSLGVVGIEGGSPQKVFEDLPRIPYDLAWAPDGKALDFGAVVGGVGNVWRLPLAGGPARPVTHFNIGEAFDLAWSPDGRKLAIARGRTTRNVVLLTNFK